MIVRRAWPKFSRSGYGLANVAEELNIQYKPHDALEDARCAGEIVVQALAISGFTLEQWLERVKWPIGATGPLSVAREGNPEGPLFGEVLVFTGALSLPRQVAADLASAAGCTVGTSVTTHTTLLVVGDQDISRLAGYEKSSKHRKAEELIKNGQKIRILSESDFQRIVKI
jgi:DNA polymerase-3 subunit epsilon